MYKTIVSRWGLSLRQPIPSSRNFVQLRAGWAPASAPPIVRLRFICCFFLGILTAVLLYGESQATENNLSSARGFSRPYQITIKGVYLKSEAGHWVKVIEPDRKVDLAEEVPVVSFFNNAGRVPAGRYKNFRIDFWEKDYSKPKSLSSKVDFLKPVIVKKGSFVHVSFELFLRDRIGVQTAGLTVDDDSRLLDGSTLTLKG